MVWAIGEPCRLVTEYFRGRPVVVWLDADATKEATKVRGQVRSARVVAGDSAPTTVAHTPKGRHDPGECSAEEIRRVIGSEVRNRWSARSVVQ